MKRTWIFSILLNMKVVIAPYNPQWDLKFLEIRDALSTILQDTPIVSIEHVGSTSVPGLKAKPVIDVDIIIPSSSSSLHATRAALVEAGYSDCGEFGGRFQFRQPGYGKWEGAHGHDVELRHNTCAVIEGSPALRNHLDLKRVLMEDAELRDEYSMVKEELAKREFDSIAYYGGAKREILWKILRQAGWSNGDLSQL